MTDALTKHLAWEKAYSFCMPMPSEDIQYRVRSDEEGVKLAALTGQHWLGSSKRAKEIAKGGGVTIIFPAHDFSFFTHVSFILHRSLSMASRHMEHNY